ncbi:MAG: MATE family efflux transporter [Oscillospiraceae bacterium]|nr:MATE family efflux transporter [Oscillospiraceae bacterium]
MNERNHTTATEQPSLSPEEQKLASAPISKLIVAYAVPGIISMVVMSIYNIVDQIFIGNGVGYLGNGATNVVYPIMMAAMALTILFANGGGALFSLRLGEKQYEQARKCVGGSVVMVVGVVAILSVCAALWLEPICRLFGCTDEILPYALQYGRWIIPGLVPVCVVMVLNSFIRADGSPRVAMVTMLSGAVLNTILDPIFIFVFHWGVSGAGFATTLSEILGFFIAISYIPRFKTIRLTPRDFIPDFRVIRRICALGMSSFVSQAAMLFLMGLMNRSYVKYGALSKYGASIPLTAMGITAKCSQIVMAFANGTTSGAQPIIGYNYGAGNIRRVKQTYLTAAAVTVVFMLIGTAVFEMFTQPIINLFGSESDLYNEFAVHCLRVFMLVLVFGGIQMGIMNFFQAIGRPLNSLIISSLRQIVLLLPAILILPRFFGLEGVVWASPAADFTAFLISASFMIVQWRKLGDGEMRKEPAPAE